ncbi:hypothetical protein BKA69DRAFT_1165506 [Paraphysoderma sedebokerense]|nr:hypothetical protein BKA69DRAFT_1165506 [Paraphysoderma sedebokerense]
MHRAIIIAIFLVILCPNHGKPALTQSSRVYYHAKTKRLVYTMDRERNRIPDFSYVGYKHGNVSIPNIQTTVTISPPKSGDATDIINRAIAQISSRTVNSRTGFRGAVYMKPGVYKVSGIIRIGTSGIVLRGAGNGDDPRRNTIIEATGRSAAQPQVIIGGTGRNGWSPVIKGSQQDITTRFLDIGSTQFQVADVNPYQVGDTIVIMYPLTQSLLRTMRFGDTSPPWTADGDSIVFNRNIIAINRARKMITIDVSLPEKLDSSLSKPYIYKYDKNRYARDIGIERLRVRILSPRGPTDEDHAQNGILLMGVDDAWVRNCTVTGFVRSGIVTSTATRVSVLDSVAVDPFGQLTPGNFYNFAAESFSNLILFRNVFARNGRHHFVVNGATRSSSVVFQNCTSTRANSPSEGHRKWSMGLLYDNCVFDTAIETRALALYNRGSMGSSHGWSAAHSVAWRVSNFRPGTKIPSGFIIIQKPPNAQNYAIGCKATAVTGKKPPAPFAQADGWIENIADVFPYSLYYAQIGERLRRDIGGVFATARAIKRRSVENEAETLYVTVTVTEKMCPTDLPSSEAEAKMAANATLEDGNQLGETQSHVIGKRAVEETPTIISENPVETNVVDTRDKDSMFDDISFDDEQTPAFDENGNEIIPDEFDLYEEYTPDLGGADLEGMDFSSLFGDLEQPITGDEELFIPDDTVEEPESPNQSDASGPKLAKRSVNPTSATDNSETTNPVNVENPPKPTSYVTETTVSIGFVGIALATLGAIMYKYKSTHLTTSPLKQNPTTTSSASASTSSDDSDSDTSPITTTKSSASRKRSPTADSITSLKDFVSKSVATVSVPGISPSKSRSRTATNENSILPLTRSRNPTSEGTCLNGGLVNHNQIIANGNGNANTNTNTNANVKTVLVGVKRSRSATHDGVTSLALRGKTTDETIAEVTEEDKAEGTVVPLNQETEKQGATKLTEGNGKDGETELIV